MVHLTLSMYRTGAGIISPLPFGSDSLLSKSSKDVRSRISLPGMRLSLYGDGV